MPKPPIEERLLGYPSDTQELTPFNRFGSQGATDDPYEIPDVDKAAQEAAYGNDVWEGLAKAGDRLLKRRGLNWGSGRISNATRDPDARGVNAQPINQLPPAGPNPPIPPQEGPVQGQEPPIQPQDGGPIGNIAPPIQAPARRRRRRAAQVADAGAQVDAGVAPPLADAGVGANPLPPEPEPDTSSDDYEYDDAIGRSANAPARSLNDYRRKIALLERDMAEFQKRAMGRFENTQEQDELRAYYRTALENEIWNMHHDYPLLNELGDIPEPQPLQDENEDTKNFYDTLALMETPPHEDARIARRYFTEVVHPRNNPAQLNERFKKHLHDMILSRDGIPRLSADQLLWLGRSFHNVATRSAMPSDLLDRLRIKDLFEGLNANRLLFKNNLYHKNGQVKINADLNAAANYLHNMRHHFNELSRRGIDVHALGDYSNLETPKMRAIIARASNKGNEHYEPFNLFHERTANHQENFRTYFGVKGFLMPPPAPQARPAARPAAPVQLRPIPRRGLPDNWRPDTTSDEGSDDFNSYDNSDSSWNEVEPAAVPVVPRPAVPGGLPAVPLRRARVGAVRPPTDLAPAPAAPIPAPAPPPAAPPPDPAVAGPDPAVAPAPRPVAVRKRGAARGRGRTRPRLTIDPDPVIIAPAPPVAPEPPTGPIPAPAPPPRPAFRQAPISQEIADRGRGIGNLAPVRPPVPPPVAAPAPAPIPAPPPPRPAAPPPADPKETVAGHRAILANIQNDMNNAVGAQRFTDALGRYNRALRIARADYPTENFPMAQLLKGPDPVARPPAPAPVPAPVPAPPPPAAARPPRVTFAPPPDPVAGPAPRPPVARKYLPFLKAVLVHGDIISAQRDIWEVLRDEAAKGGEPEPDRAREISEISVPELNTAAIELKHKYNSYAGGGHRVHGISPEEARRKLLRYQNSYAAVIQELNRRGVL
jgi:hypothetical protein